MKFSAREDMMIPIGEAFAIAADFSIFERVATQRGIEIRRPTRIASLAMGQAWSSIFVFRGRERKVDAEVVSFDPGQGYAVAFTGDGIEGLGVVDFLSLSKKRTRMFVSLELKPTSITARLIIQSLRFAKRSLNKRFKRRVSNFAAFIQRERGAQ